MAFTRKTYTGPVKDRGTVTRGGKKLADVSKEELDAFRKKAGNEDLSYKEALRKLLNADRNAKPKAKSNVTPQKVTDADIKRAREGAATAARGEGVSKNRSLAKDAKSKAKASVTPKKVTDADIKRAKEGAAKATAARNSIAMENMPDNRSAKDARFGGRSDSKPAYSNMPDNRSAEARAARNSIAMENVPDKRSAKGAKYGDKSLSVNERFKRDVKDNLKGARSSNTGTDKRSINQRIKDSLGMMGGGKVKGYGPGGSIGKGYGKARGARACKMR